MIVKFTGPCIGTMRDKKGTLYLIVEESSEGKPIPQKVKCWGRAIAEAAKGVRVGNTVTVEARMEARPWQPPASSEKVWFSDGISALFVEVAGAAAEPVDTLNDVDPPF